MLINEDRLGATVDALRGELIAAIQELVRIRLLGDCCRRSCWSRGCGKRGHECQRLHENVTVVPI